MSRARKALGRPFRNSTGKRAAGEQESSETPATGTPEPDPTPAAVEPAQVAARAAPAGLKLEASCTLRDTIDMQFQLLAVDFGESDVRIDGSAVERIDTAGLQLLLAFVRHQSGRGKSVRWTAASPELLRGSQVLGLGDLLGLSDMTTGSSARGN